MTSPVLIIDDHPANLALLEHLLRECGYATQLASDAQSALALIERETPRLILMDLQLPGIDGFELTRRLRANPRTATVPIIAVTSYAMSGDEQRAQAAGCDGYISKPIDVRAFPAKIAGYLQP